MPLNVLTPKHPASPSNAGLGHVTPHDLHHTFGSTLVTEELPQYVQQ